MTEASVYQVFDTDGQILRQETVGLSSFGLGADTVIHFSATSILPRHIDPAVNIAQADVNAGRTAIPLLHIPGSRVLSTDHCIFWGNFQPSIKLMLDGDPTTAAFRTFVQKDGALPGIGQTWRGAVVFDFGGDVPINRIRFYPRLSQREDRSLIEAMEDPKQKNPFGEDSFLDNFLAWYEIRTGDNSIPFAPDPCSISGGWCEFGGCARNTGRIATSASTASRIWGAMSSRFRESGAEGTRLVTTRPPAIISTDTASHFIWPVNKPDHSRMPAL